MDGTYARFALTPPRGHRIRGDLVLKCPCHSDDLHPLVDANGESSNRRSSFFEEFLIAAIPLHELFLEAKVAVLGGVLPFPPPDGLGCRLPPRHPSAF